MSDGTRIMVTGGSGFLGRHIVDSCRRRGYDVAVPRSRDYDLTQLDQTRKAFADLKPDVVIHAAADVGGIGYNTLMPAEIFTNNVRFACNIMDATREAGIKKLVNIGSACAYPGDVEDSMSEDDFLAGPMHPSVEVYGFSKRALYLAGRAYRQEYGLNSIHLILTNLYGPGDKFDPKDSHVVAAMIRRFVEAVDEGVSEVTCWGTGSPVREFMYVGDCAEAIVQAAEDYEDESPLNIGTGIGTSIYELAIKTAEAAGYTGEIHWDSSKPDGAARKVLDISRMHASLKAMQPPTPLSDGLSSTIDWFRANMSAALQR